MTDSQLERFIAKVQPSSGCWIWTASTWANGYGRFRVNGRDCGAHRVSYEMFIGEIPPGLVIDHLCRNVACVNPTHLEAVSQSINVRRGEACKTSQYWRPECRSGDAFRGRKKSPEHAAKLRAHITNARHDATGDRRSDATRRLMSESAKRAWARRKAAA